MQFFVLGSSQGGPTTATFALDNLTGSENYTFQSLGEDELIAEGTPDGDFLTASLDGTGELQISNGFVTVGTSNFNFNDLLQVDTLGGDDTLTVDVGGTDLINVPIFYDGGTGSDTLIIQGESSSEVTSVTYTSGLQVDEGRLDYVAIPDVIIVNGNGGPPNTTMAIDFDNLEPVVELVPAAILNVNGTNANNAITYTEGSAANRGLVSIDGFETIEFENKTALEIFAQGGADTVVVNNANLPTGLNSVIVNGQAGNDTILFESLPDASATTFLGATARGGVGDDVIDGGSIQVLTPLTFVGDGGNDTLTGGLGVDDLNGGDGDDTIIDSRGGGADGDIVDGADGDDTFVVPGTIFGDVIGVFQEAPTGGAADFYRIDVSPGPTVGNKRITKVQSGMAPNVNGNRPTIERIVVEGLAGDDVIRVGHADEYDDGDFNNGTPNQSIPFEVRGGGNASDRLIVPDDGLGDIVIHRQGSDPRSGSLNVAGLGQVDYSEIEFVDVTPLDPITGGTGTDGAGRLVIFKNDPFESNNTLPNATFLGAGPTVNVDPTIDPVVSVLSASQVTTTSISLSPKKLVRWTCNYISK